MTDIFLEWNSDLVAGSNGDLLLSSGVLQTNQRVIRRLLTNPGDYLWDLSFGGGLALLVGEPVEPARIESIIRTQLDMEASVAKAPIPSVSVAPLNVARGTFAAEIVYSDAESGQSTRLTVPQG